MSPYHNPVCCFFSLGFLTTVKINETGKANETADEAEEEIAAQHTPDTIDMKVERTVSRHFCAELPIHKGLFIYALCTEKEPFKSSGITCAIVYQGAHKCEPKGGGLSILFVRAKCMALLTRGGGVVALRLTRRSEW